MVASSDWLLIGGTLTEEATMATEHLLVVGVDGSEGAFRALEWALRHAAATGAAVEAVTAYGWDGAVVMEAALLPDPVEEQHRADMAQEAIVTKALAAMIHPPVMSRQIVRGSASEVLIAAADKADLLVVGTHGRGRVAGALLGSVSADCIRKSHTPVVVVPTHLGEARQSVEPGAIAEPADESFNEELRPEVGSGEPESGTAHWKHQVEAEARSRLKKDIRGLGSERRG
jgi:nucleotide-binding universal stress UspA family protein